MSFALIPILVLYSWCSITRCQTAGRNSRLLSNCCKREAGFPWWQRMNVSLSSYTPVACCYSTRIRGSAGADVAMGARETACVDNYRGAAVVTIVESCCSPPANIASSVHHAPVVAHAHNHTTLLAMCRRQPLLRSTLLASREPLGSQHYPVS